jgi:hypothetical protein
VEPPVRRVCMWRQARPSFSRATVLYRALASRSAVRPQNHFLSSRSCRCMGVCGEVAGSCSGCAAHGVASSRRSSDHSADGRGWKLCLQRARRRRPHLRAHQEYMHLRYGSTPTRTMPTLTRVFLTPTQFTIRWYLPPMGSPSLGTPMGTATSELDSTSRCPQARW